ncbi:MAG: hypothetical protein M3Z56_06080, partial [Bacteroidota bacterium]|nr:hypothetical protein [Bacteroidota bacterium]
MNDIFSLGELFEQVQIREIFPDAKTFVDCIPKEELSAIRERYEAKKNDDDFDLASFVHEYFIEPKEMSTNYKSEAGRPLDKHIELLW